MIDKGAPPKTLNVARKRAPHSSGRASLGAWGRAVRAMEKESLEREKLRDAAPALLYVLSSWCGEVRPIGH